MTWIQYEPGRSQSTEPMLSISKDGVLRLNEAAGKLLAGVDCIHLWYDADQKRIGLSPAKPEQLNAVRLRNYTRNRACSARAFCQRFGVSLEKTRTYRILTSEKAGDPPFQVSLNGVHAPVNPAAQAKGEKEAESYVLAQWRDKLPVNAGEIKKLTGWPVDRISQWLKTLAQQHGRAKP